MKNYETENSVTLLSNSWVTTGKFTSDYIYAFHGHYKNVK